MKSILLVKKFLGLVEMTSGLVNASFSLSEWRAVKLIFFAPCCVQFCQGQFTWYDFVACDVLTKGLRHELFNENQTKNILSCD